MKLMLGIDLLYHDVEEPVCHKDQHAPPLISVTSNLHTFTCNCYVILLGGGPWEWAWENTHTLRCH